jgi:phospholipase/lecithinase/hemolysin
MNNYLHRFLLRIFSLFLLTSSLCFAGDGAPFNKIVFFGDSLSDDGNLYAYDFNYMPKSPPYFEGRFSNRYVWSDLITESFAKDYGVTKDNFAFGGETVILHNPAHGFLPYTLWMSRTSYLVRTAYQDRSKTLFIIWIGGNDYLHDSVDVEGLSTEVVENIRATIESLIYRGGMNFLIVNLPDLGDTPLARQYALTDLLHKFTVKHNEKLAAAIDEITNSYKNININLYDVYTLFNDLHKNVAYYNKKYNLKLNNLTEACWKGGYTLKYSRTTEESIVADIEKQWKMKSYKSSNGLTAHELANYISTSPDLLETYNVAKGAANGTISPCVNPESYVFWDGIHPSRITHMMFADGISKYIKRHYDIEDSLATAKN